MFGCDVMHLSKPLLSAKHLEELEIDPMSDSFLAEI